MCWGILPRWSRSSIKFSTNLFQYAVTTLHPTPLFLVPTGNLFVKFGINQGILPCMKKTPLFRGVRERGAWFHFLVQTKGNVEFSSSVRSSKVIVRLINITIYHAWPCRPRPVRPWVPSSNRLQTAVTLGSSHIPAMMWTDIASTQQVMSRFGPNEKPQIAEFVRVALMASSIMVELRKSLKSHFMETNLLNLSCSNATGVILDQRNESLILG
jgi:hypothetical protein